MKIAIHILIWIIAALFIGDQIIKIASKDVKNSNENSKTTKKESSTDASKMPTLPPPAPPDPNEVILKSMLDTCIIEIEKATGNGSELIVKGFITNEGVDKTLRFYADHYIGSSSRLYDDSGNKIVCSSIEIGNQSGNYSIDVKLISGVKIPIIMKFKVPTVAGKTQARKIAVMELWADDFKNNIKTEFRNIKIGKVDSVEASSTATSTPRAAASPDSETGKETNK